MEVILKVNTFTRPYNFSGLPTGEYTIVVEDGTGKHVNIISYRVNKDKNMLRLSKILSL